MFRRSLWLVSLLFYAKVGVAQISQVQIDLPTGTNWTLANEQSDGDQYLREWVADGQTVKQTDWLIVEQRLALERRTSPKNLLKSMMKAASQACANVKLNGPDLLRSDGTRSFVGRIMCSHQNGKTYGAFIDQRVFVEGTTAFVVTSELRTPPTSVAGTLAFDDPETAMAFFERAKTSARFVREQVSACSKADC